VQRVVTKAALVRWSTARFYRWNAIVSVVIYVPFALVVPPRTEVVLPDARASQDSDAAIWIVVAHVPKRELPDRASRRPDRGAPGHRGPGSAFAGPRRSAP